MFFGFLWRCSGPRFLKTRRKISAESDRFVLSWINLSRVVRLSPPFSAVYKKAAFYFSETGFQKSDNIIAYIAWLENIEYAEREQGFSGIRMRRSALIPVNCDSLKQARERIRPLFAFQALFLPNLPAGAIRIIRVSMENLWLMKVKEARTAVRATGIVRRIDELGRVVIPKEIRRTLRIREGDPSLTELTPSERFCLAIEDFSDRIGVREA